MIYCILGWDFTIFVYCYVFFATVKYDLGIMKLYSMLEDFRALPHLNVRDFSIV